MNLPDQRRLLDESEATVTGPESHGKGRHSPNEKGLGATKRREEMYLYTGVDIHISYIICVFVNFSYSI